MKARVLWLPASWTLGLLSLYLLVLSAVNHHVKEDYMVRWRQTTWVDQRDGFLVLGGN